MAEVHDLEAKYEQELEVAQKKQEEEEKQADENKAKYEEELDTFQHHPRTQ